jgi:hypothetical protein
MFSSDAQRVQRFEQEARAAAAARPGLFYFSAEAIMAIDDDLRGTEPIVGTPHARFNASLARVGAQPWFDVAPDGQQFLIGATRDPGTPVPFTVISNWLALRRN